MKIKIAKSAGFCFGVKRAVDLVYKSVQKNGNVYTYGPIIHNEQVVDELNRMGVRVINSLEELNSAPKGTIILRSHGVTEAIYQKIASYGHEILDATCPFVKKIHKIVREQSEAGRHIIIIGNPIHPEVEGITGWVKKSTDHPQNPTASFTVIQEEKEAQEFALPKEQKLCIVSQTTFNYKKFQHLVEIISKKGYDIFVLNTICNATQARQTEAYQLARESDAMIVIGGKESSNSKKLYEICKKECENTYYIQKLSDLDLDLFKSFRNVGITAGASTPNNIIKEVHTACQK
ncbi:MAG: 4-hydroxy-3-methylbut-2-enyl diphosphate reductase [Clostridiales bacterium]|nr:4-hydroxy-3-methylbut-2-enyl diphosphate reductase [Clostridiales bacterium]